MYHRIVVASASVVLLFALTLPTVAQEEDVLQMQQPSRNALYVELFGQGILYSLNYDYLLSDHASLRVGFSTWSFPSFAVFTVGELHFTGFPVMMNYLTGVGSSHLEIGAGVIPLFASLDGEDIFFGEHLWGNVTTVAGTGTFGYRYQPRDGGFVFRIGLVPLVGSGGATLSGGLSLGAAF